MERKSQGRARYRVGGPRNKGGEKAIGKVIAVRLVSESARVRGGSGWCVL